MRPSLLALALLSLAACVSPQFPRSAAGYPLVYCSGTIRDARGAPAWSGGTMLMELLPDGSVRKLRGGPVKGFPSPGGLYLYTQRLIELHLSSIKGPTVGTATAGIKLTIVAWHEDVTEVVLPEDSSEGLGQHAFVRTEDLGIKRVEPSSVEALRAPMATDVDVPVALAPGGRAFTMSGCRTQVRLLDDAREPTTGRRWIKVAVVDHHGVPDHGKPAWTVTFKGWVAADDFTRPTRCGTGAILVEEGASLEEARRVLPPGFAELSPLREAPVADGGAVYWLRGSADGAGVCVEMRRSGESLSGSHIEDDVLYTKDYGYSYRAKERTLMLWGPTLTTRADRGRGEEVNEGHYACAHAYTVVGAGPEGLRLVYGLASVMWTLMGSERMQLFGYRLDDAQVWYRTSNLCEQAALKVKGAPASNAASASLGRFHQGC